MIKFNSTVTFILLFVVVTISSGLISALQGYTLGYQALKEVSQPEVKPNQKQLAEQNNQSSGQENMIVSEGEIIKQVNAAMNRNTDKATPLDGEQASGKSSNQDSFIESP